MKNISCLFIFLVSLFLVTGLCQASTTILTSASPDHTISSGSDEKVYGTSASNRITIESSAKAELVNFPGQNIILIHSTSDLFTVNRSGTVVTFQGADGTVLKIPSTTSIQTITFSDRAPLILTIYGGEVMLDDQVITLTPASIEGGYEVPSECGAYISPGVWKEFDCYNLAAIGKTTGDDPFTPSWKLIGGYWQWGRKGPDPSQWYDTNTPNFAHGPTGPGSWEDNSGSIFTPLTKWDSSNAPDGAWSDSHKTASDPCPTGYRVPTKTQWDGVLKNNTQSTVGTWSSVSHDYTNYSAARFFGSDLMLPAAGYRSTPTNTNGSLYSRGSGGCYWGSPNYSINAWSLNFGSETVSTRNNCSRLFGFSVRCIAE